MAQSVIRGVRSVALALSAPDVAARFFEGVWGLQPVESPGERRLLRGTGAYHHILSLQAGRSAILRVVFDVAGRAGIDRLHAAIGNTGVRAHAPRDDVGAGGGYGFSCIDPEGRCLAFVCGVADHADANDMPDRPRKITHVSLNTGDFDASYRFFTNVLGFRLADENRPLTFLHCDNSDHHSVVLARAKGATLNHIAFEMPDLDSVMRGAGRMKDHGYPIEWGVGRHGPGNNVFAYFAGPDELPIEYTAEVLQVDDAYVARGTDYWKFTAGRSDQWGVTGPRSARLMRIQDLFGFPAESDTPT